MWYLLSAATQTDWRRAAAVDAQLVLADATRFSDLLRSDEDVPKSVHVLVRLKPGRTVEELQTELVAHDSGSTQPAYKACGADCCTAKFALTYCNEVHRGTLGQMIERFELQMPVIPSRSRRRASSSPHGKPVEVTPSRTRTLLGIIDSGCPFANSRWRDADRGTRVLSLWDQDEDSTLSSVIGPGGPPKRFGYGRELQRSQLADLIEHSTWAGAVDEGACYELAHYPAMRRRLSHGAFAMDLMAGPLPFSSRSVADPDTPPSWLRPADEASRSDIVFVQLPRDVAQDSSSAALARHVLDGLRHIVACAGEETRRIVVNLSDGSSRTTHDGSSILELAMQALVAEQAELQRSLSLVVAAGNTRLERRHAYFDSSALANGKAVRLRLLAPGSCEAPQHILIRVPAESQTSLRIAAPGEALDAQRWLTAGEAWAWPSVKAPQCIAVVPPQPAPASAMGLIKIAPTTKPEPQAVSARAGEWTFEFKASLPRGEALHVYIARSQQNPGTLLRGRQAFFVDEDYDSERYLRAAEHGGRGSASPIRRDGTLNGLATSEPGTGVVVVGASLLREASVSPDSSVGPAAGPSPCRLDPDACAPADTSRALQGITGAGNASGAAVRMRGTSFAAPQIARDLANDG